MSRLLDHGLAVIMSMIGYDSASESQRLPRCGTYALNEAYQTLGNRKSSHCGHDLRRACHNQELLDRYIWSLSAYCLHSKSFVPGDPLADYKESLRMLQAACPDADIRMPLEKRQSIQPSVIIATPTTTPVLQSTTPTTVDIVTSTTPLSNTVTTSTSAASLSSSSGAGGTGTLSTSTTSTNTGGSSGAGGTTTSGSAGSSSGAGATGTITTTSTTTKPTSVSLAPTVVDTSIVGPLGTAFLTGSTTNPVVSFPTSSYTGQAVLTSTCAQPMYTAFPDADGSFIAAPIIGCDNQNPQCCPSLTQGPTLPSAVIPLTQLNGAVMDALNSAPITTCPGDYTSTAGVCCPVGFDLYNTQFYSLYPCVSALATAYSVPAAVTQQLLSLGSAIAGTATDANPTVSVHIITDQVFALSLPLKGGVERTTPHQNTGLPLAAKIGIGVGAVLVFVVLGFLILMCLTRNRRRGRRDGQQGPTPGSQTPAWLDAQQRESLASTATTAAGPSVPTAWDPRQGHFSYDSATTAGDAGAGGYYKPTSDSGGSQYVRTPPPRTSLLQPMPMAQISPYGHAGGVQPTYSELPAHSHEVFEADAGQAYGGQHQQGGYSDTAYQGPAHGQQAYEMEGLPPQQQSPPPQQYQRSNEWI